MVRLPLVDATEVTGGGERPLERGPSARFVIDPPLRNTRPRVEELELLGAVLDADPEAEAAFVVRYSALIEHCVRRVARSRASWVTRDDLQDIISEVWVSLWERDKLRLRRFDPSRRVKVSTWIGMLARNCAIDWLRAHQDRALAAQVLPDLAGRDPLPTEQVEHRERWELASRALKRLSDEERRFMRAWYVDGRDSRDLARQLGITVATVYTRRFKIVAKLAQVVDRLPPAPVRRVVN